MYATFTYVYQVPGLSQKLNFSPLKWVTDNWELSGMTQLRQNIRVGVPSIGFSNTNSTNLVSPNATGTSGEGARMLVIGDWKLPSDQVSFLGGVTNTNIGVNGTPGNAIINNGAFMIPNPCSLTPQANPRTGIGQDMSCFGNAGPGSADNGPGYHCEQLGYDVQKALPVEERSADAGIPRGDVQHLQPHAVHWSQPRPVITVGRTIRRPARWFRQTAARAVIRMGKEFHRR